MPLSEADTRAKLIDPALHVRGWTEDLIRREENRLAPVTGIILGIMAAVVSSPYTTATAQSHPNIAFAMLSQGNTHFHHCKAGNSNNKPLRTCKFCK